jgi:hydroxymethylpyrimidine pyrophosphatase-like HAD family hydrolase
MKGIISFDMDMTLLDHSDFKIPESAYRAIERLREQYYIAVATGRDLDSKFSAGLRELVEPDAVIHLNGTKVTVGSIITP